MTSWVRIFGGGYSACSRSGADILPEGWWRGWTIQFNLEQTFRTDDNFANAESSPRCLQVTS